MAYGSSRAMRGYVNKTFAIEARLRTFTDTRREPTVAQGALMTTWFWGMAKRLPSTEQKGDLLKDPRWRRRVGIQEKQGGSPDTAARVLDQLLVEEINELALE